MLALTDSQLAHLAIAATAVAPEQREQWLREIADKLDPPSISPRARSPAAVRQAKLRQRRKSGMHYYGMWISDRAADALIMRCILEGRLTEEQATKPRLVTLALAALLEEDGQRCAR